MTNFVPQLLVRDHISKKLRLVTVTVLQSSVPIMSYSPNEYVSIM
jgi:hypothetical protein